ncbi:hypothetical protein AB3M93_19670 [Novosphingobium panipatense]|uniref:hypothetical protein n=1 Tax=Novosphingobium TaxID=165696 RepID=UPI001304CF71|nr:hypothetical protein [Novosphingobium sp. HII-3]
MNNPDEPSTKRKRKAGVTIVAIVVAIVAVIFVGYNISHVKEKAAEEQSDRRDYTGLN